MYMAMFLHLVIYPENLGDKMKILLVLTGGTICSAKNEEGLNDLSTDAASLSLVQRFKEYVCRENENESRIPDIQFVSISPVNTLSENMTISKWNQLISALKCVDYSDYAGVILLHGTDTLHMTSALMGILMRNVGCPVMMVSAHRILTDPVSNGYDNFNKSVELILRLNREGMSGVYVVFRNMNGVSYVHHATHLEECEDYSEEFFSSDAIEFDSLMSEWNPEWLNRADLEIGARDKNGAVNKALIFSVGELRDDVLYIRPYVGMNYDRINLDGVRVVLHGMYHSSTCNTEGDSAASAMSLLRRCKEKGIEMYIFPCKEGEYRYSTTKPLIDEGAKCIYGGTWEEAYVRLLIG